MLKSGTSFNSNKISKVRQLFTPPEVKGKVALVDADNDLAQFDKQLSELKSSKPKDKAKFEEDFKHLVNKRKDTLNKLRHKHGIKIDGDSCPEPLFSFPQIITYFDESKYLAKTLKSLKYDKPTPVQMQAIPLIKERRSSIILAETGSGKTMAFAVPLLQTIERGVGLRAVVLAPTRELTIQLYKEFLILSEQHLTKAPRVKFLRKAMMPHNNVVSLNKFLNSCEILIASPLKFGAICELFPTIN